MNPEQILLESYISSTGNEISLEEFVNMINQDPSVLDNLYTWNEESAKAIDQLFSKPSKPKKPLQATTVQEDEPKKPKTEAESLFAAPGIGEDQPRDYEVVQAVNVTRQDELIKEISDLQAKIDKDRRLYPEYDDLVNNTFRDESEEIDPDNPSQNIKAGPAGLTKAQSDKIINKLDRQTMFQPYDEQVVVSGIIEDGRIKASRENYTKIFNRFRS